MFPKSLSALSLAVLSALSNIVSAQTSLPPASTLTQITADIGPNPNNVGMFVYRPATVSQNPALIVAIHFCTGSAQAYFTGTQYAQLSEQHGFIVIYPDAPREGKCFDVHSTETLTHNGGGDSQGIASMVQFAIDNYGVDASKVFVTGTSSGAMMTNVMAGSYPDLFAAASIYSGVPFGCFAGTSEWNTQCAEGQLIKSAEEWGDEVRAAFPGYTGARPKMMIWHGTIDETLLYPNFGEEIKEWTNVLDVSQTPTTTTENDPESGYTKTTYGDVVVGYSAENVGHTVPVHADIDLAWFGIA
ncbi:putative acetylxylan esterase [Dendrothele bispora CBS 962.96]|uniref:Carboxylic ester hydrolase n=1 Tax=Dendrothele bispora (strain CBS 962.96) TaxID=1314807 RepID=A0A4S8MNF4_DENBC|nr:putative acetylxylan esterase [Dendrothele bispora CBS 962.96]